MVSRRSSSAAGLLASLAALGATHAAQAAPETPTLRFQADVRGDVAVFGSSLAHDCGSSATPPVGATISCAGETNVTDTAPDIFWRDDVANASIEPSQARTSATLVMPASATAIYARLYWSAIKKGSEPDAEVTIDFAGGPTQKVTADTTWTRPTTLASFPDSHYYQASGDVTAYINQWGAGDFRITDVESMPLSGLNLDRAFSAWTIVVFYENAADQPRNLALFDGFSYVAPSAGLPSVSASLAGFLVPPGFDAKMTAFAYEGDSTYTGDSFSINGTKVSNAVNPASDFFNSSRSYLGAAVSGTFDVPKLSGLAGTMSGYDLDTVDIGGVVKPGDTEATIGAASDLDIFLLGGFVTSITSYTPSFEVTKTAADLNGGALVAGDEVEYVITAKNVGNDASVNTAINDRLEPGVDFVPGSLRVDGVAKTDPKDADQAEYDGGTRRARFLIGAGATASKGGSVAIGGTVSVSFRVKIPPTFPGGSFGNQALVSASGEKILAANPGDPGKEWASDGDPSKVGAQKTVITVNECQKDDDCSGTRPRCNTTTFVCEPCSTDANCTNPLKPACQPDGSCNECSTSNDALCTEDAELCNTIAGVCAICTPPGSDGQGGDASKCAGNPVGTACVVDGVTSANACGCTKDSDCGAADSGRVCDAANTQKCVDGCRGEGGNGCPAPKVCTSKDSSLGTCVTTPENTDALCSDGIDNDQDGKIDCADTDCQKAGITACLENTDAKCKDGKDNDGDGDIDCNDTDCQDNAAVTVCPSKENTDAKCKDGKDNDADGKTDCDDEDCQAEGVQVCAGENTDTACGDGKDNDDDGLIDCKDPSCAGTKPCPTENTVEKCQDGLDNDGNGKKDCADDACKALSEKICGSESTNETCSDQRDNDGNGKTDCADASCSGSPTVTVCKAPEGTDETCQDGVDNDKDGQTDCTDTDCQVASVTVCGDKLPPEKGKENDDTSCSDKKDNDGDGKVDCEDSGCQVARVTVCRAAEDPGQEGGCGCVVPGDGRVGGVAGFVAALLGFVATVGRRRASKPVR